MAATTLYDIDYEIYRGAHTVVYRGHRRDNYTQYILKTVDEQHAPPQIAQRLRHEFELLVQLDIDGVIRAYDLLREGRVWTLVLDDITGVTLADALANQPGSLDDVLHIGIRLTDILAALHQHHITHKDLNPTNIIVSADLQRIQLIDFGIASMLPREQLIFTAPARLEGTLAYISPEQTGRINRTLDYRTDFYALGVVLYELLTGQVPFSSDDPLEVIHNHLAKRPEPPNHLRPDTPQPISDIIMKLLRKGAADRYQSALGLRADLDACQQQLQRNGRISVFDLGRHDFNDHLQLPQTLYGRETEVQMLLGALERVCQGCTELILVSGYAGVGKSALVQELHTAITRQRGYYISGKFDQLQRRLPYAALGDAFRTLVLQVLTEPDDRLQQWREQLCEALGNDGQVLIDLIPEVELIVGPQPPLEALPPTQAQNRFNRALSRFIDVFCTADHPLILFLDDLQWADMASLKWLELILSEADRAYLLLIGAYRDNAFDIAHPLYQMLETLRQEGQDVLTLQLTPLALDHVCALLAETLRTSQEAVRPLATLVHRKTHGNPFFVRELIKTLEAQALLTFVPAAGGWQWEIDQIEAVGITENVIDLMTHKLQSLPPAVQAVLQHAACIGNTFDLATLILLGHGSASALNRALMPAIEAGLIQAAAGIDELIEPNGVSSLVTPSYTFIHDRVQQAAYDVLDPQQRLSNHLQIGLQLLQHVPEAEHDKRLFEIVDHLNLGRHLLPERPGLTRQKLAELNLAASLKSKASAAFAPAYAYAVCGLDCLDPAHWRNRYPLMLSLHEETAQNAYLCGHFVHMEIIVDVVLQHASTFVDTLKVYETAMSGLLAQHKNLEATQTGLYVLSQLGFHFPEMPTDDDVSQALEAMNTRLSTISIDDLAHLPPMSDATRLAAMRLLSLTRTTSYMASPNHFPLLVCKAVELSIRYGHAKETHDAYAAYGIILCGLAEDYELGRRFADLAMQVLEHDHGTSLKAKTLYSISEFVRHWSEPHRHILAPLLDVYQRGLDTGDVLYAGYGLYNYCYHLYLTGASLPIVAEQMDQYLHVMRRLKQERPVSNTLVFRQAVANLMQPCPQPACLSGRHYDELEMLPRLQQSNDLTGLHFYYFNRLMLHYIFGQYDEAVTYANLASQYLHGVRAKVFVALVPFYEALSHLAVFDQADAGTQAEILITVTSHQTRLQRWAEHAPMNHLHRWHLVAAERARVEHRLIDAMNHYDTAIALAREQDLIHESAIANELAGQFWLAHHKPAFASIYLTAAHSEYQQWGAQAKAEQLASRAAAYLTHPQASRARHTNRQTTTQELNMDAATAVKAAQAISSQLQVRPLLSALLHIAIENAGAQRGYLLSLDADNVRIHVANTLANARGQPTDDVESTTASSQPTPLPFARNMVNYVRRTREPLVVDCAVDDDRFRSDPHVAAHQVQSVVCLPLVRQGELAYLLYLENNLTDRAFTPDRIEVLRLLTAQAAISLENAQLYQDLTELNAELEHRVQERTAQLEQAQQDLVDQAHQAGMATVAADVLHNVGNVLTSLNTSATMLGRLLHDSKLPGLGKTNQLLDHHRDRLGAFFETDPKGQKVPDYLQLLDTHLNREQRQLSEQVDSLHDQLQLVVDVISAQQQYACSDRFAEDLPLDALIDTALLLCGLHTNPPGLTVCTQFLSRPEVRAQRAKTIHALVNLIQNAQDAMEAVDTDKRTITITVEQDADQAYVNVADNGCGIRSDQVDRLFKHGFTTKPNGHGFGLHSCANNMAEMGGRIWAESEGEGRGATFILSLPLAHGSDALSG